MSWESVNLAVAQHAHVCLAQCRWADAAALYSWLLERQPKDARLCKALAYALIEQGRTHEATAAIQPMDARSDAVAQYLWARIHMRRADPKAREFLRRFAAWCRRQRDDPDPDPGTKQPSPLGR